MVQLPCSHHWAGKMGRSSQWPGMVSWSWNSTKNRSLSEWWGIPRLNLWQWKNGKDLDVAWFKPFGWMFWGKLADSSEVSHGKQLRREERVYPPGNLEIVCFFVVFSLDMYDCKAHRVAAWCKLTTSNNLFLIQKMLYTTFMQHILQQQPVSCQWAARIPPSYKLPTRDETQLGPLSWVVWCDVTTMGYWWILVSHLRFFSENLMATCLPDAHVFFIGSAWFEEVNKMVNRIRQRTRQNVPSCCYLIVFYLLSLIWLTYIAKSNFADIWNDFCHLFQLSRCNTKVVRADHWIEWCRGVAVVSCHLPTPWSCFSRRIKKWAFPKIGVPPNHPF